MLLLPITLLLLTINPFHTKCLAIGPPKFPPLLDASLEELAAFLHNGSTNSFDLVQTYLDRIAEVNSKVHAVTEVNPDALVIARDLDLERAHGIVRGPLHGIPMLLKDNIATMDQMNNTAGSVCLLGARVREEATVTAKLRKAGAIILGKSNMSQWAGARSSHNSTDNGWSAYGGQTYGAYRADQDPSGSSSGSAVAVSIGLAAAALGTETAGSIISPSEYNNLVGIKPTVGLTSRHMVIPITLRQDTVGPIARTVTDAALVLSAIAGKDPSDNYTSLQPFDSPPDYTKALNLSSLAGARIGVPRNAMLVLREYTHNLYHTLSAFNDSLDILSSAGATIVDPANFSFLNASIEEFLPWALGNASIVFEADFLTGVSNYLSNLISNPLGITTFQALLNCTKSDPREQYPDRDIADWEEALALNLSASSPEAWAAYQANLLHGTQATILGALETYDLDALVLPSEFAPFAAALAGSPVITVPLGVLPENAETVWDNRHELVTSGPGIPFGLSFLGAKWSEEKLVGYAYAFEQRTKVREKIRPIIFPKTELGDRGGPGLRVQDRV